MSDFSFLENPISHQVIIAAPKRARRPNEAKGIVATCPFCPGAEGEDKEVYRVSSSEQRDISSSIPTLMNNDWSVRVIPNRFPFALIHEIVILSPDHHKGFDELPQSHVATVLRVFQQRFQTHHGKGQVYIFNNHGMAAGESLPHPHTQLAVVPFSVPLSIPSLAAGNLGGQDEIEETDHFWLFCPEMSQWPDEVWIAPKKRERFFDSLENEEIEDLAFVLQRLLQIMDLRHKSEFPFNFYIYPGADWYLRLIPRIKTLGGFEIGTGVFVNTQDPTETMHFIQTHFHTPNIEQIKAEHQAKYRRGV